MMARKSRYFFNVLDIILREIFKSSNVIKNSEGGGLTCFPLLFCSRLCNIVRLMLY